MFKTELYGELNFDFNVEMEDTYFYSQFAMCVEYYYSCCVSCRLWWKMSAPETVKQELESFGVWEKKPTIGTLTQRNIESQKQFLQ